MALLGSGTPPPQSWVSGVGRLSLSALDKGVCVGGTGSGLAGCRGPEGPPGGPAPWQAGTCHSALPSTSVYSAPAAQLVGD